MQFCSTRNCALFGVPLQNRTSRTGVYACENNRGLTTFAWTVALALSLTRPAAPLRFDLLCEVRVSDHGEWWTSRLWCSVSPSRLSIDRLARKQNCIGISRVYALGGP